MRRPSTRIIRGLPIGAIGSNSMRSADCQKSHFSRADFQTVVCSFGTRSRSSQAMNFMLTPIRLGALFLVAVGAPFLASETEVGRRAVRSVTNSLRGESSDMPGSGWSRDGGEYAGHSHYEVEELRRRSLDRYRYEEELARKLGGLPPESEALPELVGTQISDLRDVLRFDITPDDVPKKFSRVSTVLSDLSLRALRVPLVTGTKAEDIAGTLTYYFDTSGKLQRLTIHGFTGEPGNLLNLMTGQYGLRSEPTLEAGVYTRRWNGQPVHFLRLTHAPVVFSDAIHQKYTVFLELNQPDLAHGISSEARKIVSSDRVTGRW